MEYRVISWLSSLKKLMPGQIVKNFGSQHNRNRRCSLINICGINLPKSDEKTKIHTAEGSEWLTTFFCDFEPYQNFNYAPRNYQADSLPSLSEASSL